MKGGYTPILGCTATLRLTWEYQEMRDIETHCLHILWHGEHVTVVVRRARGGWGHYDCKNTTNIAVS